MNIMRKSEKKVQTKQKKNEKSLFKEKNTM